MSNVLNNNSTVQVTLKSWHNRYQQGRDRIYVSINGEQALFLETNDFNVIMPQRAAMATEIGKLGYRAALNAIAQEGIDRDNPNEGFHAAFHHFTHGGKTVEVTF